MSGMIGNYFTDDGSDLGSWATNIASVAARDATASRHASGFASGVAAATRGSVAARTARASVPGNATAAAAALVAQIKASFRNRTAHPDMMAIAQALYAHNVKRGMSEASKRQWYSYFLSMAADASSGSDLQVYFATVAAVLAA